MKFREFKNLPQNQQRAKVGSDSHKDYDRSKANWNASALAQSLKGRSYTHDRIHRTTNKRFNLQFEYIINSFPK